MSQIHHIRKVATTGFFASVAFVAGVVHSQTLPAPGPLKKGGLPSISKKALLAGPATRSDWGATAAGEAVDLYTLTNLTGVRVEIATYGATLVSVETPDREGVSENITLSYPDFAAAEKGGLNGNIVGRFANRIDTGGFTLDGKRYDLETVNPKTKVHIHGGKTGIQRQVWKGEITEGEGWHGVKLTHTSPDGHEGFPGEVAFTVEYRLDENSLTIDYQATTTKPTHLNLTNHAYFNLSGDPKTTITDHILELKSDKILAIDDRKIPTGNFVDVTGTPFDFRKPRAISETIEQIEIGGFDHCFVSTMQQGMFDEPTLLDRKLKTKQEGAFVEPTLLVRITDPKTGRVMEVLTTQPGVQIYTANHMKEPNWPAICFETQHFPDSPNKPNFPTTVLRTGEKFHEVTIFRFGIAPKSGK